MFTFVVTCYNQARLVPYALESIRDQICQYGKGQQFQLILADDGSTDESRAVMERWLRENGGLFARVDRLYRAENGGICQNYVEALRLVVGERFVVLNGDDLFAPYSLFAVTDLLAEYDIVCSGMLHFSGSCEIARTFFPYWDVLLQAFLHGKVLRRSVQLGCAIMSSAVFRKELLTEEVFDFILRFRTVNDRACFQKIVGAREKLKICYVNRPFLLYRISEKSLSHFHSPTRTLHNREVALLCREARAQERSRFFRALLLWQEKAAAFRSSPRRAVRLLRFFSPYYVIMLWLSMRHCRELVRMKRALVDAHCAECRAYYQALERRLAENARTA